MKITVIGAGNLGLALCAFLSQEGHSVCLYNRTKKTIQSLMETHTIEYQGVISGRALISCVTTDLCEATNQTQLILIATPAYAHKELAVALARCLKEDVPIVLNLGRTFGAIEFYHEFCKLSSISPLVSETQSTVFTCRKVSDVRVDILSLKHDVLI